MAGVAGFTGRKTLLIVLAAVALGGAYGLYQAREAPGDPAAIRQRLLDTAMPACLDSARAATRGTAVTGAQVARYCGCAVPKGIAAMSDAEVLEGHRRAAALSDADREHVAAAAAACRSELLAPG